MKLHCFPQCMRQCCGWWLHCLGGRVVEWCWRLSLCPRSAPGQLLQHCSTAASCSAGPDRSSGRELPQTSQHSITCHLLNSQKSVGRSLKLNRNARICQGSCTGYKWRWYKVPEPLPDITGIIRNLKSGAHYTRHLNKSFKRHLKLVKLLIWGCLQSCFQNLLSVCMVSAEQTSPSLCLPLPHLSQHVH